MATQQPPAELDEPIPLELLDADDGDNATETKAEATQRRNFEGSADSTRTEPHGDPAATASPNEAADTAQAREATERDVGSPPSLSWWLRLWSRPQDATSGRRRLTDKQAADQRLARILTPVAAPRVIAVVAGKGGVGKTTTALYLGHAFGGRRGERVVALDAAPAGGTLGRRVPRENAATTQDLLAHAHEVGRYADLRAYTSLTGPSRLEVVAAPDDPQAVTTVQDGDQRQLLDLLARHYQLLLVDSASSMVGQGASSIIEAADQLVVVSGPSVDTANATGFLLSWLNAHGYAHLVADAVVVINAVDPKRTGRFNVDALDEHFSEYCRSVVRIPRNQRLAYGDVTHWHQLPGSMQDAYLDLAAAVADGFTDQPNRNEENSP